MTSVQISSYWRTASITALGDILSPSRITSGATRMALQLFLVVCLWRSLYKYTTISAGLSEVQGVSYAVLAVLAMRIRGTPRFLARDMVLQHVQFGTIVYWFLRPMTPQRYYLLREVGDQLYGFTWAIIGYALCVSSGVLSLPSSLLGFLAFAASLLLGQSLLYYLVLLTDQACFWAIKNSSAVGILVFAQNLLSGAYAALWYFPHWFQMLSLALPFEYTMGVPLSFYIGRLAPEELPGKLAIAAAWILALAIVTRLLWRRAGERVVSQGG